MSRIREIPPGESRQEAPEPEGKITRRELLSRLSPLGRVELDASLCTGCGLCVAECPSRALSILSEEGSDRFQLVFKHGTCVACGQCVEICPEKCLSVKRVLEPDKQAGQSVLFEDTLERCSECGQPIGPKSMIEKMKSRVMKDGKTLPFRFELCPECKIKARFSNIRM